MPLDEYRAKRDFATTPEPAGGDGTPTAAGRVAATGRTSESPAAKPGDELPPHAGLLYVIQKHAASRLHYDFRLELDGVLLSWAVPKGPSLDPRDKRFAARVEDHPVEYGGFEGTIPKGEYGGGTVELWDRGTWEPEGDPHAGLGRGDLKFTLHGEKLRGSWVLVRMRQASDREGKENWLLIKHRDPFALDGDGDALLRERPESVLTGRGLDEIAADAEATAAAPDIPGAYVPSAQKAVSTPSPVGLVAESPLPSLADVPGAVPAALGNEVPRPQLATLVRAAPDGDGWLHEIKLDGYRTLARIDAGRTSLFARGGGDWSIRYPEIAHALGQLSARSAVLDGEVVVMRDDGVTDFGLLQADLAAGVTGRMRYAVFDLLYLDGYDLTGAPLTQRKELLTGLLAPLAASGRVFYVEDVRGQGPAFAAQACAAGLEGVISKRTASAYQPGSRSRDWLKVKCLSRAEFVVVGYTPPGGSRTGFGALLLAEHDADGTLRYAGRVGTGFTARFLDSFGESLRALEQPDPTVDAGVDRVPAATRWVAPRFIAEVAFAERTTAGELRQASFKGLREDAAADEALIEAAGPDETGGQPSDLASARDRDAPLQLTNPQRVFWPRTGATKQDLAGYYERVAEHMLPYVLHRPVSMVRCPHGVADEAVAPHPGADSCFFHKHPGADFPGSFQRIEIVESKGPATYLAITSAESLTALAQMGVLEIHTWGSTWPDIEHPDVVVFDLDPGDGVGWRALADSARLVRDALDGLGLVSFVKTTGGKGLHVCAPIVPEHDWEAIKRFARSIADGIAAYDPERYIATMAKAKRDGRIYIDYLRNGRTATFIAPYSTRAHPRPTVAVPLRWDELRGRVRPDTYDITTVPRRLAQLSEDPWEGYLSLEQRITAEMMGELGLG